MNCQGWTDENKYLREKLLHSFKFDIISLNETFLRDNKVVQLNGYTWFGNNRTNIHYRAVRGSGGVGLLVLNNLFELYNITLIDKEYEGVIGIRFCHKLSGYTFIVFSVYLPPENSARGCDSDNLFAHLMGQLYLHEDVDAVYICGDFNSHISDVQDCVEEIDCVPNRQVLDKHGKLNVHGQSFLDFLKDGKLCVVNGRVCNENDNFTSVSSKGQAVVDYFVVPHDVLQNCLYYKVHTMRQCIDDMDLSDIIIDPKHIPDHSLLTLKCLIGDADFRHLGQLNDSIHTGGVASNMENSYSNQENATYRKYRRFVPDNFLQSEDSMRKLTLLIDDILTCRKTQSEVDNVFETFCEFYHSEMNQFVGYTDIKTGPKKKYKTKPKPWWNDELTLLWKQLIEKEKQLGKTLTRKQKKTRHSQFRTALHNFDKLYRKHKRKYLYEQQIYLENINVNDPKQFWQHLKTLGPRSNKSSSDIPMEVYTENGQISYEADVVLDKWADCYSSLYSQYDENTFDDNFYEQCMHDFRNLQTESSLGNNPELNKNIVYSEVNQCVQLAKNNKAVGLDNLPYEIFKNKTSIDLLTKLFNLIFSSGLMPTLWLKAVIKPIPKGSMVDPRVPLQYRGICLLSTVSKLYTSLLNNRLLLFCENNGILVEEQNGFRKKRSCEEHIFSLASIIRNPLNKRKNTFAAFIDMEKAFDKVDRNLLLFKLLKYGINGNMYKAIRSLCNNTTYTVNLNGHNTRWFNAELGVRQGDCISPTLFSLFINDMANEVKEAGCGIQLGDINVSILLYADDVVLVAENEANLQCMLNTVTEWCHKWRLKTSVLKSKVVHFRHTSSDKTNFHFQLSGQEIECIGKYKYLGIIFDEHLTFNNTANTLSDSGGRALGKLLSKLKFLKGLGYNTYTHLFESYVVPILLYGSGVWGYKNFSCCETVQNRAIRAYLGVHRFAPNHAIWGDMGWMSIHNRKHECMIKLWNRFINMNDSRLCKRIFLYDVEMCSGNWSSDIYKLLSEVNMTYSFENSLNVDITGFKALKYEVFRIGSITDNCP